MKTLLAAAAFAVAIGGAASAQPISQVTVSVGPKLQSQAKVYGQRELDRLTVRLLDEVQGQLDRAGRTGREGARLNLVITDAVPNHPTFKQLGDHPGLSMDSFGLGGASIEGELVNPDGSVQPVTYHWYETDIRQSYAASTWSDADYAFDAFARRFVRDGAYARAD